MSEELWKRLARLIPVRERRFRYPGRLPVDDRGALEGILWVLRNDVLWRELPAALFGVTCWRRLRDWADAGVWQALNEQFLAECNAAGLLDLRRALVDFSHIHVLKGLRDGSEPGQPSPPRQQSGLITDASGVPLATIVTGGNRHDVIQLIPLVKVIPPIRGRGDGHDAGPAGR